MFFFYLEPLEESNLENYIKRDKLEVSEGTGIKKCHSTYTHIKVIRFYNIQNISNDTLVISKHCHEALLFIYKTFYFFIK